jgi:hypothetical protein
MRPVGAETLMVHASRAPFVFTRSRKPLPCQKSSVSVIFLTARPGLGKEVGDEAQPSVLLERRIKKP